MTGFVDLHCHWICEIDDGARDEKESLAMLRALKSIGFDHVAATPHMRPGMFNNTAQDLRAAFRRMLPLLEKHPELPSVSLGSEHFFDEQIVQAIFSGHGLPYRASFDPAETSRSGGAILIEFHDITPLPIIEQQFFQLQTNGYLPVIAHPERYQAVWKEPSIVKNFQARGCVALLDTAALAGKYGRRAKACARELMKLEAYDAACSDAHRPKDAELVARGIDWIERTFGEDEVRFLFSEGPTALLEGRKPIIS